ncbi:MAG: hypothetical protein E7561_03400 [Ruminococcaceae bacterium]|nr:hypothetical protein [Oscillospiraceae bacterium]
MIKIGIHFFNKRNDNNDGFFVYDIVEKIEKEEKAQAEKTVFERVLERQQKPENNPKKLYSIIFGVCFLLLLIITVLGCYLNVYSKNLPAEFCEEIVSAYEGKNTDLFLKHCTNLPKELKNKANLQKYLNNFLPSDDCGFYQVSSKYNNSQRYIFESGTKKIGEILFVKNKKSAAFGIDSYTVESFEMYPLVEYNIATYSTCTLKINGKEINKKYLQGRNTAFGYFTSSSHTMVTQDIYAINDLKFIEEISVVDTDGKVYEVPFDASDFNIDTTVNSGDKQEELLEFFKGFVYNYMYYTVVDNKNPDVVLYDVYEGTNIYNAINRYYNDDTLLCKNSRIENLKVEEILYYGSGYYTCTVSADYLIELEEETVTKSFQKQVSLLYSDGRYYVINLSDVF